MFKKTCLKSIDYAENNIYFRGFLALLAGAILFFAFAPFGVYPLAIIAAALLLFSWCKILARQAFLIGGLFGISFFGCGASWVYISLHNYGFMPIPIAVFVTALFVLFLTMFPALQGYCLNKFFPQNNARKMLLVFPALCVISEWLRSWLFSGFPWLNLGYSQIDSPLRGLAPIFGVYGITFAVAFTAGAFVYLFLTKNTKTRILPLIIAIMLWLGSANLANINWTQPSGEPIKVSLIQGNIAQESKWQQNQLPHILQQYYNITTNNWQSKIIVWPEAAIPTFPENIPSFIKNLDTVAKAHHTTIISGIPLTQIDTTKQQTYYNGIISLGMHNQQYRKRHLVPFGEYTPLPWLYTWLVNYLAIPMSNFSAGPDQQEALVAANTIIAPFVCYEITYPNLVLDFLPQAQLLLTISDDSWFGRSVAADQHIEIARMRSAESGRYQLVGTNTGITAIIDDHGRILKQAPIFQQVVLNGEVQAMNGSTPWVKFGHYFWLGMILLAGVLWLMERSLKFRKNHL